MTRGQRRAHLAMWLVLGPLVLAALGWALTRRAEPPPSALPGAEASP
ncbi:MAG: hypothetical protein M5U28_02935 [Sandaracinaceae bacterium]|nr:hypothetical protein [Sandaracinaceae bacterium]